MVLVVETNLFAQVWLSLSCFPLHFHVGTDWFASYSVFLFAHNDKLKKFLILNSIETFYFGFNMDLYHLLFHVPGNHSSKRCRNHRLRDHSCCHKKRVQKIGVSPPLLSQNSDRPWGAKRNVQSSKPHLSQTPYAIIAACPWSPRFWAQVQIPVDGIFTRYLKNYKNLHIMMSLLSLAILVATRRQTDLTWKFSCIHNAIPKENGLWIEFKP